LRTGRTERLEGEFEARRPSGRVKKEDIIGRSNCDLREIEIAEGRNIRGTRIGMEKWKDDEGGKIAKGKKAVTNWETAKTFAFSTLPRFHPR
jgi:hypothetical protein